MAGGGVQLLFGPMLLGVFFNTMLYGVMVVQTFIYFQTYKRDRTWIKIFVFYLLFCETLNTGFDMAMMYEPLIMRYGTPEATTIAPIMLSADPLLTVMISSAVQLFIAWRVRVMSRSYLVPGIICFFAITSFIGGIATTVSVTLINEYVHFHKFDGAVITWLASSAAADVMITVSLVWSLWRQRTGFSATDDVLNKLIRLTVQTGMITAISATLDVTLFLAVKGTTLNYIWDFALSKLYSNSLLSTLNARGGWKTTSTIQENVLFGGTGSGTDIGTQSRKQTDMFVDAHIHTEYELNSRRISSNATMPLKPGVLDDGRQAGNHEYTISVTRVVEQFAEEDV